MEPFLGQIQAYGFNFAPRGWALCDGQTLEISQNNALFALLGTTFGGDGRTTFKLPDLRGRSMVHQGTGIGLVNVRLGETGGREQITLSITNLPTHNHGLTAATATVQTVNNGNVVNESDNGTNVLGTGGGMPEIYRESPTGTDHLAGVSLTGSSDNTGSGAAFGNRDPFVCVNVCIALLGDFPSRN